MPIHVELAHGRWHRLTLAEQLGNVGSEVNRTLNWQERDRPKQAMDALERLLELMDLTLTDPRWHGRRRELARAREVICDFFYGGNQCHSTAQSLRAYFDAFALLARASREATRVVKIAELR